MEEKEEAAWSAGLDVLRRLTEAGHPAYLVGGCVRDRLLGRRGGDIDIATAAEPTAVMSLFADVLPTGLKHGTVTVREAGFGFEVTTFRQESGYSDARHPDAVAFVRDVREDLARRDFTVNAMAMDADGALVDPFGGQADMRDRVLRAVGHAAERFGEDALRMLRGIRFAAELGYRIDESTWDGLLARRDKLRLVAMERVGAELDKMIGGADPARALTLLSESGLADRTAEPLPPAVVAGLRAAAGEMAAAMNAQGEPIGGDLRWAALFVGCGATAADVLATLRVLRYAGRRAERIASVARLHERLSGAIPGGPFGRRKAIAEGAGAIAGEAREGWIRAVLDFGREAARDWLRLAEAAPSAIALGGPDGPYREASRWLREMPAAAASELAVRGDELVRHAGLPAGPWVARHLRLLLEEVALGRAANEKTVLLAAFASHLRKER
ncbi:hypothetical protein [Cohnella nanjingensis]|uniref:CCA tRNA nucleotidyltransferase n=1 Tax=Cohnella nanjingensis TaxID=1387779 RepID=A0A7X0RV44_9BACL|nr:hypothetical protein [Cohnella nanjingensis]MBB6674106.1 hypothetical protein [Cohnella nanjingensis]